MDRTNCYCSYTLKTPSKLLLNQWRNSLTQCKEWALSVSPPAIRLSPLTYTETFSLEKECRSLLQEGLIQWYSGSYNSLCVSTFLTVVHYWIQDQAESFSLCSLLKYDAICGVETAVFKSTQE